jgi:hypothetical protein
LSPPNFLSLASNIPEASFHLSQLVLCDPSTIISSTPPLLTCLFSPDVSFFFLSFLLHFDLPTFLVLAAPYFTFESPPMFSPSVSYYLCPICPKLFELSPEP